jgi:hypothetical protein
MTPRERLLQLIEEMDEERVEAMLLLFAGSAGTSGSEAVKAGENVEASKDPFGGLIGMIGDEYEGPTDVSMNIHKYVADAIESEWRR